MIRFKYHLRSHGWARAVIADEDAQFTVTASYLSDALTDFVDSVQRVFTTDKAECVWEQEPGQVCWKFRRDGIRCSVELFWDSEEQAKFSSDDDLLHFGSEVEKALRTLLEEWGETGYFQQWGYAFPHEAHRRLSEAIEMERNRRGLAQQDY
jgi:hypothetical protein